MYQGAGTHRGLCRGRADERENQDGATTCESTRLAVIEALGSAVSRDAWVEIEKQWKVRVERREDPVTIRTYCRALVRAMAP